MAGFLFLADLSLGTSALPIAEVVKALLAGPQGEGVHTLIVYSIRLPMTLTAVMVGCALALSGLIIQTITANSLASPSTLGITSGASYGASLSITWGISFWGQLWLGTVVSAFIAALIISMGILALGRWRNMSASTLILAGIIMNFFFMALQQLLLFRASPETAQLINGWTFGNLERSTHLSYLTPLVALIVAILYFIPNVWSLTILMIGQERARSLGVRIERLRTGSFLVASLLVASAVSFIGTVSFIGLVAPHCAKLLLGDDQRYLLPGALLLGTIFMLSSNLVAKLLSHGTLLPVGIVTSLVGVPFLFFLLIRDKGLRV